eukprot:129120-Chlamydomonas_euryale.AAC.2
MSHTNLPWPCQLHVAVNWRPALCPPAGGPSLTPGPQTRPRILAAPCFTRLQLYHLQRLIKTCPRVHVAPCFACLQVYHLQRHMRATGVDLLIDCHADETLPYNFVSGIQGRIDGRLRGLLQ